MHENVDSNDILQKPYYNLEKAKEWHDIGLHELLGIFINLRVDLNFIV